MVPGLVLTGTQPQKWGPGQRAPLAPPAPGEPLCSLLACLLSEVQALPRSQKPARRFALWPVPHPGASKGMRSGDHDCLPGAGRGHLDHLAPPQGEYLKEQASNARELEGGMDLGRKPGSN